MNKDKNIRKYFIYALLHEDSVCVFVNYASEKSKRFVYKDHYAGKNSHTKELFQEFKEDEEHFKRPKMYILAADIEKNMRYSAKLAWIRYFAEHGFNLLNDEYEIKDAENPAAEALDIYESIRDIPLSEVVSEDNETARNFKSRKKKDSETTDDRYIIFKVTPSEHAKIKENADNLGMSLNAYSRDAVIYPQIVSYNYDVITDHLKEIAEIKADLLPLIAMLLETKTVYRADINKIISLINELVASEKSMLKAVKEEFERRSELN